MALTCPRTTRSRLPARLAIDVALMPAGRLGAPPALPALKHGTFVGRPSPRIFIEFP